MTLGEKIKRIRKQKGLTQSQLCGDRITRNMLSLIENGSSMPSVDTLIYLCDRLGVPAGYLLSDNEDKFTYRKNEEISKIRELFRSGNYSACVEKITELDGEDDEICYLLSYCHFYLGEDYFYGGSLQSAARHLELALAYSSKTIYDTKRITTAYHLYSAICNNVNSPLLEFNSNEYSASAFDITEAELFNYLTQNYSYPFSSPQYAAHAKAKLLIKERKYSEAITILKDIEDTRAKHPKNAYLIFSVYSDLDNCYRQLMDFESAYKYATKRISLLEGFSS